MKYKHLPTKLTKRLLTILAFATVFTGIIPVDAFGLNNNESARNVENQQFFTVSGNVTSSIDGMSMLGVNIFVKGTQIGTITDVNGDYNIEVPGNDATLVFSFIGFETQGRACWGSKDHRCGAH